MLAMTAGGEAHLKKKQVSFNLFWNYDNGYELK